MAESASEGGVAAVPLTAVPKHHPDAAVQKVAGRWMAATADDHLHTFEEDDGQASDVGERIIELVDGVRTVDAIVTVLTDEFDVSRDICESDTREFIGLLVRKQVLVLG